MSTQKLNIYTDFGLALKEALLIDGKSSAWLSRVTGKDKGQISKYINGSIIPREITQRELTRHLSSEIRLIEDQKWELISLETDEFKIREEVVDYKDDSYNESRKKLKLIFKHLKDVQVLFEEIDRSNDLSEEKKLLQIRMIRNQLRSLLD